MKVSTMGRKMDGQSIRRSGTSTIADWFQLVLFISACLALAECARAESLSPVTINDNRLPAGNLRHGVLQLHLEIREGVWHPLEEDGDAIKVFAFAEAGKALSAPAPLIRVPEGTRIELVVQSSIAVPATLHGLHERPGNAKEVITIQPNETRRIQFLAGKPGTYSYWAAAPVADAPARRLVDSQLAGGFVIDPPGETPEDRIFILTRWNGPLRTMINGKSWPFTERLKYTTGEHVQWKWINASDVNHPMHCMALIFFLMVKAMARHSPSTMMRIGGVKRRI